MFGLLLPRLPSQADLDRAARHLEERIASAVPWTPDLKWQPELNLKGSSWNEYRLFDTKPVPVDGTQFEKEWEVCPGGHFLYHNIVVPKGFVLSTWHGKQSGTVIFDSDTAIPVLYGAPYKPWCWRTNPWMSLTAHEVVSLRCGERFAKGHTVIGGLGLGWQLLQVSKRKQVNRITLVEQSQDLVDWILPKVLEKIGTGAPAIDVIVGDAYKIIPKLTADAALIDIYPNYGGNTFDHCPHINKVWVWGSTMPSGNNGWGW